MSASILPTELLQEVFSSLHVQSLLACRAVCQRWRDLIDDSPGFWEELCQERYHEQSADSKRRAGLSWRDYYKCLTVWPAVASTSVKIHKTEIRASSFQLLANGTIGCPKCSENQSPTSQIKRDTIVYYDLATLEECNRRHIGLDIKHYTETEQIIVIVDEKQAVHVIPKINNKKFLVGKLKDDFYMDKIRELIVLESEVYFKNSEMEVMSAQLGIVDNEITVQTTNLGHLYEDISTATRVSYDEVNFLVTTGIMCLKNGEFEELCTITSYQCGFENNCNTQLEKHGFKWSQPEVFKDLSFYDYPFEELPKNICSYKSPVICSHGDMVLLGTARKFIHIFHTYQSVDDRWHKRRWCDDESENVEEKVYNAKLLKSIDLKKLLLDSHQFDQPMSYRNSPFHGNIDQMEVVEMVNGHKLIVIFRHTVCIVELLTDDPNNPPFKRKASKANRPKSKVKKLKKTVKK